MLRGLPRENLATETDQAVQGVRLMFMRLFREWPIASVGRMSAFARLDSLYQRFLRKFAQEYSRRAANTFWGSGSLIGEKQNAPDVREHQTKSVLALNSAVASDPL